jgi:hypothetical protein
MDSPSTAQKRKRDVFEDVGIASSGDFEDKGEDDLDTRGTPTKRLRASGSFEPVSKGKESGLERGSDDVDAGRSDFKRRKIWPDRT